MAINSLNDLVQGLGASNSYIFPISITTGAAYTSARFHFLNTQGGTHGTFSFSGTALQFQNCNNTTPGGLWTDRPTLNTGEFIYLTAWQIASNSSTTQPSLFYLIDIIGYYPGISTNTTSAQSLTGTVQLRGYTYTYATLVATTTTGSTSPDVTISYTNQDNTANRTSTTLTHGSVNTHGVMQRPFALNLQGADRGIRSVQTITFSAATTGTVALMLFRPLACIPLHVWNMATEREFLSQIPSLPVIPQDACLGLIQYTGASQSSSVILFGNLFFTKR